MSTLRPARPEDAPAIAAFQVAMAEETEDRPLDPALVGAGVLRGIEDPAKGSYWVVEEEGQVAASLLVTREWSDWRDGWIWWIQSVFVRPASRGRGHYAALYREVQRAAQREGEVRAIRLYVETTNTTARAVYERLGMEETGYLLYEAPVP